MRIKLEQFAMFLQFGDECAQEVVIEHGGHNVTFSDRDLSDTYSLEVNQRLKYIFTMYLKLADGHEMVYWNGELDLTPTPASTSTTAYRDGEPTTSVTYIGVFNRSN